MKEQNQEKEENKKKEVYVSFLRQYLPEREEIEEIVPLTSGEMAEKIREIKGNGYSDAEVYDDYYIERYRNNNDIVMVEEGTYLGNGERDYRVVVYYNIETTEIIDDLTETTKKWLEMESKYKNDLKKISELTIISSDEKQRIREDIIVKWLEARAEFLKRHKDDIIVTAEDLTGCWNDEIIVRNKRDLKLYLVIDKRFILNEEMTAIDKGYRDLFKCLFEIAKEQGNVSSIYRYYLEALKHLHPEK